MSNRIEEETRRVKDIANNIEERSVLEARETKTLLLSMVSILGILSEQNDSVKELLLDLNRKE